MASLVKYELKKIASRRVTQVASAFILALLVVVSWLNISMQYALVPDQVGEEVEGVAAIAQQKANADALAGPITDEAATEAIRELQSFIGDDGEIAPEFQTRIYDEEAPAPTEDAERYWRFHSVYGKYLALLTNPYSPGYELPVTIASRMDTGQTLDLYGQARAKLESKLDDEQGEFAYTDAERAFWLDKAARVQTPVEYGYAGGWLDFLDMAQSLIFALLLAAIACAGAFNVEYRDRTDAVLLSTRLGKSRLGIAKVVAAFVVTTVLYAVTAAVLLGMPLALFGADGAGLPLQVRSLSNAYGLTVADASVAVCLAGYAATLALLGIVLALSSRMRSQMGILAIAAAIVLLPLFAPQLQNNVVNHVLYLFPYFALDPANLFGVVSYAAGPVVVEYPVVLAVLYLLVFAVGTAFAVRSFSRHQVA